MEALARGSDGELGELWSGHGGEAMSRLLSGLIRESGGLPAEARAASLTCWNG
jgi:ATP-dependent helicase/nuclease subunit B